MACSQGLLKQFGSIHRRKRCLSSAAPNPGLRAILRLSPRLQALSQGSGAPTLQVGESRRRGGVSGVTTSQPLEIRTFPDRDARLSCVTSFEGLWRASLLLLLATFGAGDKAVGRFQPMPVEQTEIEAGKSLAWRCRSCARVLLLSEPAEEPESCTSCRSTGDDRGSCAQINDPPV
jgi:hypothetical protein